MNPPGSSGFAEKDEGLRTHMFTIASGGWDTPMRRECMDHHILSSSGGSSSYLMKLGRPA
jgi:hypothetical protein